jgi:chemotaxis protein MotB
MHIGEFNLSLFSNSEPSWVYFVVLCDVVMGIAFIFLIALLASSMSQRITLNAVEQENKLYAERAQFIAKNFEARADFLGQVQDALHERGIVVDIDVDNGILRLPEFLLFDSGSAELRSGGSTLLRLVSHQLGALLPCTTKHLKNLSCTKDFERLYIESIVIEGHTDNHPVIFSSYRDNWDLSMARAKRAYLELVAGAPHIGNVTNDRGQSLISFSSFADKRPIADNDTEVNRRKNRRIDLRFSLFNPEQAVPLNGSANISLPQPRLANN